AAPPDPAPAGPVDLLLEGFARRFTQGYAAAAPTLRRALDLLRGPPTAAGPEHRWLWTAGSIPGRIAVELWDDDAARDLTTRQVRRARACGALVQQQFALGLLAHSHLLAGDLSTAQTLIEEDHAIAVATGNPPQPYAGLALAAWRGRAEPAAASIAAALHDAVGRGDVRLADAARYASAVLYNGLGRHQIALGFARRLFERDSLGYGALVLPELVEAAQRTGELTLATTAMRWLSVRATATPTDWACGIEARGRALLAGDATAEELFVESAARLDRTRVRVEVARTRLLYGEWLRRQRRRRDAREQLRTAHELFTAMGLEAFAERAGRELLATGEHARKRTVDTSGQLTPQEAQIAGLARDGLANPEIGARLFISPRTVQYHLHKVFAKLDINSRTELARASW
ncbi:MAG TPA: LuxR C-terminal-related transcriptional regulator, partial [Catenuloplanes sp.]